MDEDAALEVAVELLTSNAETIVTIWSFHVVVLIGVASILGLALADGRDVSTGSRAMLTLGMIIYGVISFVALQQRYEAVDALQAYLAAEAPAELQGALARTEGRTIAGFPFALALHPPSIVIFIAYSWLQSVAKPRRRGGTERA